MCRGEAMRACFTMALLVFLWGTTIFSRAAFPLPRSYPEAQGVASAQVREFVQEADRRVEDMHSFMLLRHGHVVAEGWWTPFNAETPHVLYSLSKSFTSTAVGLAIAEGKLSLDDEVSKFFPEDLPAEPSNNLKAMRLRDLLTMSTGHQTEPQLSAATVPWTRAFLTAPVPHKPGAHFLYNTPATYMQSAIVQKVSGQTVLDFLRPRLFEPLGVERPEWGASPQGITLGGYGLSLRTEEIAKFGQLYLQKGKWRGRQLVPADWIAMATGRQVSNGSNPKSDWEQGYGFQFWRCRNGAYRGDGAFGQYCIVMPEQNAVIAITSGTRDMQAVLNLVWDKLMPALRPARLKADPAERGSLEVALSGLKLPSPKGIATSPKASLFTGKEYRFAANDQKIESLRLEAGANGEIVELRFRINGGEQRLRLSHGQWIKGTFAVGSVPTAPVAATAAWTSEDELTAKVSYFETPASAIFRFKCAPNEIECDMEYRAMFGQAKPPKLVARAE